MTERDIPCLDSPWPGIGLIVPDVELPLVRAGVGIKICPTEMFRNIPAQFDLRGVRRVLPPAVEDGPKEEVRHLNLNGLLGIMDLHGVNGSQVQLSAHAGRKFLLKHSVADDLHRLVRLRVTRVNGVAPDAKYALSIGMAPPARANLVGQEQGHVLSHSQIGVASVKPHIDIGLSDHDTLEGEPGPHKELIDERTTKRQRPLVDLVPFTLVRPVVEPAKLRNARREITTSLPLHPQRAEAMVRTPVHPGVVAGDEPLQHSRVVFEIIHCYLPCATGGSRVRPGDVPRRHVRR